MVVAPAWYRVRADPVTCATLPGMDTAIGDDGVTRCVWGGSTPDYAVYHDTEWGFGVSDDTRLFGVDVVVAVDPVKRD